MLTIAHTKVISYIYGGIQMEIKHAMAYTTIAMKKLGYSKREMESITNTMLEEFQQLEIEQVESIADHLLYEED